MSVARKERIPLLIGILEESNLEQLSALSSSLGDMCISVIRVGALLICGRVFQLLAADLCQSHNPLLPKVLNTILNSKEAQSHLRGKYAKEYPY